MTTNMEQQQPPPQLTTEERLQGQPATTRPTFDKGKVTAIYMKSCDEWTEEEAAYVSAFEAEEERIEEERKQKEAERKAESNCR